MAEINKINVDGTEYNLKSKLYEHIINMPVTGMIDGSAGSKTLTFKFLLTTETQITIEQLITELNNAIKSVPSYTHREIYFENGYITVGHYGPITSSIYVEAIGSGLNLIYEILNPISSSNIFSKGGFETTTFSSYVVNEISDTFKLNIW